MGENIISTGLTPDPVAVARLPDASQRLESSVSGDLPLLQTWRWVWRRGSRLYALGERTARVIYLKRHTVTRGARAVWYHFLAYVAWQQNIIWAHFFPPSSAQSALQNSLVRRGQMTSFILTQVHSRRGDDITSQHTWKTRVGAVKQLYRRLKLNK